ncbi:MAG: hypothetical protein ACKOZY_05165, partial [Flavobacteriales bacterium]
KQFCRSLVITKISHMFRHIITLVIAVSLSATIHAQLIVSPESYEWTITGETTREQLGEISKTLYANNFKFAYQPEFDGNRRILSIKYTISNVDTGALLGSGEHQHLTLPQAKLKIVIDRVHNQVTSESSPH